MTHDRNSRLFRNAILVLLGFALASALLMWSWNTLGHELFGGPEASFKHGLAAAAVLAIGALFGRGPHSKPESEQ